MGDNMVGPVHRAFGGVSLGMAIIPRLSLWKTCCVCFFVGVSIVSMTLMASTHNGYDQRKYQRLIFNSPENYAAGVFDLESAKSGNFVSLESPVINHLHYSYPINARDACHLHNVKVILPVNSAVTNFKRRQAFREGEQRRFATKTHNHALMLFFVGLPSEQLQNAASVEDQVEAEARQYGDIVQVNVVDTYFNLTLKALGVLNWISSYCSGSEVVLKSDDDTTNIRPQDLLLPVYQTLLTIPLFIMGETRVGVKPDVYGKCKISKSEFSEKFLPPFALGYAVGYPTSVASVLYQQALRTKLLRLDDAFLTGICRQALGIPLFKDGHFQMDEMHNPMEAQDFVLN